MRGQQGDRTAFLGVAGHVSEHLVEQRGIQRRNHRLARPVGAGIAASRTGFAQHVDFAGVALHARLDAYANARFAARVDAGYAAAQTAGQRSGELRQRLPVGGEFAGLRFFAGEAEAVVLIELVRRGPDFGRRVLGDQPTRIAALLQAVVAGVSTVGQRQRARYIELTGLLVAVGDVHRDRQQRVEGLALQALGHLHRCGFMGIQIIGATVTEVTVFAPQPAAAGGVADNQGERSQTCQSLHAEVLLGQARMPVWRMA
ncbi:MAG: hypothetical protein GAK45_02423 [Pseudomonas citronellolis]|nr:MAG: hypothetical protein GAK45_02423 [Pseudomonas citronellolis]